MLQPQNAIIKKWANGTTNPADVVLPPVATSNTVANQEIGLPPSQEQDPTVGGQYVKRAEINGIFKLYSEHIEFINKGGNYTFNNDIANAGGYSQGATLWNDYYKRFVTSLKDNNTDNFTIDGKFINGISWEFTELSEYINLPEITLSPNFTGDNGSEIVIYCNKKQYIKNTINALVKFSIKTGTDNIATYSLKVEGNPTINAETVKIEEYQTSILTSFNNTGAMLEIKTYGGYNGALETKPSDFLLITLKVLNKGINNDKWQPSFSIIDYTAESINTIVPVIGNTVIQANNYLGTALIEQNEPPKILYYPNIKDDGNNVTITGGYINLNTNNFTINNQLITRTKKLITNGGVGHRVVGNITATKINFKQTPADNEIVYLISCDFVVFSYPLDGYIYMPDYGVDAGNIDFGSGLGENESFGNGTIFDISIPQPALCAFRYSNQNIPEKNRLSWGSIATKGTGRFSINFYANSLNNNF